MGAEQRGLAAKQLATGSHEEGAKMGNLSFFHWIIVLLVLLLYIFPVVKILQKAGYSGWWCVLVFIPLVNVVMLWVFAFARWPNLRDA
jgi:uncharacterized membrane protein YhaH (DUF805 family)